MKLLTKIREKIAKPTLYLTISMMSLFSCSKNDSKKYEMFQQKIETLRQNHKHNLELSPKFVNKLTNKVNPNSLLENNNLLKTLEQDILNLIDSYIQKASLSEELTEKFKTVLEERLEFGLDGTLLLFDNDNQLGFNEEEYYQFLMEYFTSECEAIILEIKNPGLSEFYKNLLNNALNDSLFEKTQNYNDLEISISSHKNTVNIIIGEELVSQTDIPFDNSFLLLNQQDQKSYLQWIQSRLMLDFIVYRDKNLNIFSTKIHGTITEFRNLDYFALDSNYTSKRSITNKKFFLYMTEIIQNIDDNVDNYENTDLDELINWIVDYTNKNNDLLNSLGIKDIQNLNPQQAVRLSYEIVEAQMNYQYETSLGQYLSLRKSGDVLHKTNLSPSEKTHKKYLFSKIPQENKDLFLRNPKSFYKFFCDTKTSASYKASVVEMLENKESNGVCANFSEAIMGVFDALKAYQKNDNNQLQYLYCHSRGVTSNGILTERIVNLHQWNTFFYIDSQGHVQIMNNDVTKKQNSYTEYYFIFTLQDLVDKDVLTQTDFLFSFVAQFKKYSKTLPENVQKAIIINTVDQLRNLNLKKPALEILSSSKPDYHYIYKLYREGFLVKEDFIAFIDFFSEDFDLNKVVDDLTNGFYPGELKVAYDKEQNSSSGFKQSFEDFNKHYLKNDRVTDDFRSIFSYLSDICLQHGDYEKAFTLNLALYFPYEFTERILDFFEKNDLDYLTKEHLYNHIGYVPYSVASEIELHLLETAKNELGASYAIKAFFYYTKIDPHSWDSFISYSMKDLFGTQILYNECNTWIAANDSGDERSTTLNKMKEIAFELRLSL